MNGMPSFANPTNLEPRVDPEAIELPAGATPLQFLEAVYRSPAQPMHRRLKAACEALPFVHPKLSVIAQVGPDFADAMERAFKRSSAVLQPPKMIEHQRSSRRA
jgi:hypothetical protein